MNEQAEIKKQWYVIRVTFRREMAVKSYLDGIGIENYIPMRWIEQVVGCRKRRMYVPLIHNLIFVHTEAGIMRSLKASTDLPICYIMDRETKSPAVIPEREMNDFMAIVASGEQVEVVEPQAVDIHSGDRVRVKEGPFKGIEGFYIRCNGKGKVAVAIRDIATALTAYIPMKNIEKI